MLTAHSLIDAAVVVSGRFCSCSDGVMGCGCGIRATTGTIETPMDRVQERIPCCCYKCHRHVSLPLCCWIVLQSYSYSNEQESRTTVLLLLLVKRCQQLLFGDAVVRATSPNLSCRYFCGCTAMLAVGCPEKSELGEKK